MGVRLFKKFLSWHWWIQLPKTLDQTTLAQITPAQLMRKAATVRNTQVTLSGETPMEGTKTKRSPGPSFHESRTAYIHANQAGYPQ